MQGKNNLHPFTGVAQVQFFWVPEFSRFYLDHAFKFRNSVISGFKISLLISNAVETGIL
jgi:hypothetical protein